MPFQSAQSVLQVIKELTPGELPDSGTVFVLPVKSPQTEPNQRFIDDDAWRGGPGVLYDQVQGVRNDKYSFKMGMYADLFPILLVAALGSPDTVTGSGPYEHAIGLLDDAAAGSQPPSLSVCDFDGANYFTELWSQLDSLEITWTADGAVEILCTFLSQPYTDSTAPTSPFETYNAIAAVAQSQVPGWDIDVAIDAGLGYATNLSFSSGTITINRKTEAIFTSQPDDNGPFALFAGPIEVTGKFEGVISTQEDPLTTSAGGDWALTRFPVGVQVTFQNPADGTTVEVQMSQVQLQDPKRNRGKIYDEFECQFKAQMNTTDAVSPGLYAPITTVTTNTVATAYN